MKNKKKDIKQKSFFFDDYTESEINSIDKKYSKIQISLNRVTFLFFIFISFISIFSIKIIYLSLYPEKNLLSQEQNQYF